MSKLHDPGVLRKQRNSVYRRFWWIRNRITDVRNVARDASAPGPSSTKKSVRHNIAGARDVGLNRWATKNEGCRVLGEGCRIKQKSRHPTLDTLHPRNSVVRRANASHPLAQCFGQGSSREVAEIPGDVAQRQMIGSGQTR